MNSVVPEETEADSIDPDEYAALQQKIDDAHDQFLIKHLNRVWPKNFLRIVGILQILLALAFVGVDLPIVLMYAPRWQIFAGCWAFLFALIAGIMTIRSSNDNFSSSSSSFCLYRFECRIRFSNTLNMVEIKLDIGTECDRFFCGYSHVSI